MLSVLREHWYVSYEKGTVLDVPITIWGGKVPVEQVDSLIHLIETIDRKTADMGGTTPAIILVNATNTRNVWKEELLSPSGPNRIFSYLLLVISILEVLHTLYAIQFYRSSRGKNKAKFLHPLSLSCSLGASIMRIFVSIDPMGVSNEKQ